MGAIAATMRFSQALVSSFSPARLVIKDRCATSLTKPGSQKVLVFPEIRDACSPVDADSRPHQLSSGDDSSPRSSGPGEGLLRVRAIVKERFDAFMTPPSTAAHGHN